MSTASSPVIGDPGLDHLPRGIVMNGAGHGYSDPPSAPTATAKPLTNEPTFQDDADAVLRLGRIVTSFRRIGIAIRDPRCKRPHLIVLYALMEAINQATGTAFPSRRTIGQQEGLSEKTVENVLYELRNWGHIDWERRAEPDLHKGRLLHYTLPVARWSEEDITKAIVEYRAKPNSPRPDGYSECPPQGGQKVPVPAGTLEKSPRPDGAKSPRPDGVRNLLKEPEEKKGPPQAEEPKAGQAAMMAALGGQPAYAARNITVKPSGKVVIGEELRSELRETYTDSQIERGVDRAPSQAAAADQTMLLLRQAGR